MSREKYDLIGCFFGTLEVIKDISTGPKKRKYKCKCIETGLYRNVIQSDLLNGKVRGIDRKCRHGKSGSPEYMIWESMIGRCHNKKDTAYNNYGARGIKVCERWRKFIYFYIDMGDRPSSKHTIDRIDNNAGYSKDNCRWSTRFTQSRNHRRNVIVKYKGAEYVLVDACALAEVDHRRASYHLSKGRDFIDIVKFLKRTNKGERWHA